jgi:hypothetical protein
MSISLPADSSRRVFIIPRLSTKNFDFFHRKMLMIIHQTFIVFATVLGFFAIGALPFDSDAQRKPSSGRTRVRVYFVREGDFSPKNPFNLQPVLRTVDATAPARPALEALLAGPTAEEQEKGFIALDTDGLSIVSLTITGRTARVSLARRGGPKWAGTLAPATLRQAVERTLRQFPTIRRVIISVDGYTDFDADTPSRRGD